MRITFLHKRLIITTLLLTACSSLAFAGTEVTPGAKTVTSTEKVVSSSADAAAQQKISDAWFTGPLNAANATTLPKGVWLVQPYLMGSLVNNQFDHNGNILGLSPNGHSTMEFLALVEYGITDNFTLGVIPRVMDTVNNGSGSSSGPGFGDTTLRLQYMFHKYKPGEYLPTISLLVDETFPSGDYENLSRYEDGFGSGSYTTTFTLATQYYFWVNDRILRMRLNGQYATGTDVDLSNMSSYGTPLGFHGKASPGDMMSVDLSFEYSLSQHWVPVMEFIYTHTDSTSVSGNVSGSSYQDNTGSSENFSIAPAMEYNINDSMGFIGGVQITVAGRNTSMAIVPQISFYAAF